MDTKVYKISEIGEVVGGGTPSTEHEEYWNGDIPWVSPKDLTGYNNVYISHGENFITQKGLNKSGTKLLPQNTVLFSSRAPIGYIALAANPICTNQGFKSIVCNEKLVSPLYLYYYIKSNLNYIKLFGSGATFPEISGSSMKKIKINIFTDLIYQRRIASILSAYDNLIDNNNRRIRLLEQMAENLYKEWFVRFRFPGHEKAEFENGLPKGWKIEKYDKVSTISAGGDKPEFFSQFPTEECNVPIYSNGIVDDGLYGYTNKARINKPCITISARGTVGFVCMRRMPFVPIVRLLAVVPKNDLNVYYLYHSSKYNDLEGNGTSQQQLTVPMLNKRKIVIPINDLLVSFRNKVEPLYNQINMLKKKSVILSRQRDLLLPRLMSGKLEVKA